MWKTVIFGVGVTLHQSCCYGYQSADVSIFLKFVYFWPNFGLLLRTLSARASYKLIDSLEMKANFNTILPYFSLNIPLRRLYCNFNCSDMLLWASVIQITQIHLSTNSYFWVINWKPHIEILRGGHHAFMQYDRQIWKATTSALLSPIFWL